MVKKVLIPFLLVFGLSRLSAQSIYPARLGNLYGYIDSAKNWVIPARFDQAGFYEKNKAMAMSGDSLFLVTHLNQVSYLPGLRNFKELNDSLSAIQNKWGKWAIADHHFKALSTFDYNSLDLISSFLLASKNELYGVINQNNDLVFPFQYRQLRALDNGQFMGIKADGMEIIDLSDSPRVVIQNSKIEYNSNFPSTYLVRNKTLKTVTYYSTNGDSILTCRACQPELTYGQFAFIKTKQNLLQFNLKTNLPHDTLSVNSPYWTMPGSYLYLKERGCVYDEQSDRPLYCSRDSLRFAEAQYFYSFSDSGMGLVDVQSKKHLEPAYDYIYFLDQNFVLAHQDGKNSLIRVPEFKTVLLLNNFSQISITESSILVNSGKAGVLYAINSNLELTDSMRFKNLAAVRTGTKNANDFNFNGLGMNNSLNTNWFRSRGLYGLRNENGDTLLKPFVFSVRFINDSLDLVSYQSNRSNLLQIRGYGSVYTRQLYGIINNRTGQYLLRPSVFFIDYNQLQDSNFKVVRTVLRNGYFALINKDDWKPEKSTLAHYISPYKNGYMRAFYKPRFSTEKTDENKRDQSPMYYLSSFLDLCEFGQGETRFSVFQSIYVCSESMNAFDLNGNKIWMDVTAHQINHIENAQFGKFIGMNKEGKYGVIDSIGQFVIPMKYEGITRLEADPHFFVLSINNLKYGYINAMGKELTEASFSFARPFKDGYAWAKLRDSLVLLNEAGGFVETGLQGGRVAAVSEGISAVKLKKGWVLVDTEGQQIGSAFFRQVNLFKNGAAVARIRGGWGLIDRNGHWIVPAKYTLCVGENSEAVVFSLNNHLYFFDRSGQELSKTKEKGQLKTLGDSYFRLDLGHSSKIYNSRGELFSKRKFKQDLRCQGDTVIAIAKTRVFVWNAEGKKISSLKHYGGSRYFDNGMLKFDRFKSHQYETILLNQTNRYFHPDVFADSLEWVRIKKPRVNQVAFSLVNYRLPDCLRNNALVYEMKNTNLQKSFCLSDSLGNLLINEYFAQLKYLGDGLYMAGKRNENGQYVTGILNALGVWILEPKFKQISNFENGKAIYTKTSDFWIADENGQLICSEPLVNYLYKAPYYCLQTEDQVAWWHPEKGWLIRFH